ncbi:glycosyltransferase [Bacteroides salyersiae]|nr:glycosyltransferase [Bacteroides salyersiae]
MKNKKQAKNSIKKLSILIPAYNESKTIVGILEKIIRVDLPETIKKEIIIIDDCSTDHTDEKVARGNEIAFRDVHQIYQAQRKQRKRICHTNRNYQCHRRDYHRTRCRFRIRSQ